MTVFSGGQSDAQALKQTWTSQPGNEVAIPTTPARSAFFDRHPLDLQMFASDAGVTGAGGRAIDLRQSQGLTYAKPGASLTNTEAYRNAASYARTCASPEQATAALRGHVAEASRINQTIVDYGTSMSPQKAARSVEELLAQRDAAIGATMAGAQNGGSAVTGINAAANRAIDQFTRSGQVRIPRSTITSIEQ